MDQAYASYGVYLSDTLSIVFGVHGEIVGCSVERPVSSFRSRSYPFPPTKSARGAVVLADQFDEYGAIRTRDLGGLQDLNLGIVNYDPARDVVWAGVQGVNALEVSEGLVLCFDELYQIIGVKVERAVSSGVAY